MAQSDDKFFQPRWWTWISGAKQGEESRGCSPLPDPQLLCSDCQPRVCNCWSPMAPARAKEITYRKSPETENEGCRGLFPLLSLNKTCEEDGFFPTWQGWTRGNGSNCTRAGLDWRLWRIYSLKGLSSIGRGCPRKLWSHHSWSI